MKQLTALLAALVVCTTSAGAQDFEDLAAYRGIVFTNPGLITPLPPDTGIVGVGFNVRWSTISKGDLNDPMRVIAAGFDFDLGPSRLGVQAFYGLPDCDYCDGGIGFGADLDVALWSMAASTPVNAVTFTVGLRPAFGVTKNTVHDQKATSFGAGVPLSVAIGQRARVTAFVAPGLAWGRTKEPDKIIFDGDNFRRLEASGTLATLGAGIGVSLVNRVGINLGVNKVFVERGEMVWGLAIAWQLKITE